MNLVFASDWPVVPSSPLEGVHVAVNRKLPGPHQALNLDEAVSAEQALLASTIRAAEMAGLQDSIGSIRCASLLRSCAAVMGLCILSSEDAWLLSACLPSMHTRPPAALCDALHLQIETVSSCGNLADLSHLAVIFCLGCRPGKRADFAVLSASPLDQHEGTEVPKVVQTYLDGTCMHGCSPHHSPNAV